MIGSAAKLPCIFYPSVPPIFHPSDSSWDPSRNLRKRKRSHPEDGGHPPRTQDVNEDVPREDFIYPKKKKTETRMTCIRPPDLVFPKSAYDGHVPSMPRYCEERVLQDILVGWAGTEPNESFSEAKSEGRSKKNKKMAVTQTPTVRILLKRILKNTSSIVLTNACQRRAKFLSIRARMNWYLFTKSMSGQPHFSTLTGSSGTLVDEDMSRKCHLKYCLSEDMKNRKGLQ